MHGMIGLTDTDATIFDVDCTWYALMTDSEKKACIWLRKRQYEPYWARYMGPVKVNRHRTMSRWRSVLPGYLFLPIPMGRDPNWRLIEESPGIRSVMRQGNFEPVRISSRDIDEIRRIEGAMNASEIAAREGIPFKVGQKVRVINDTLGFEGTVIKLDTKRKITIEVPSLFGRVTKIMLPVSEIEAI